MKEIPPSIYFGGAACGVAYFVGVAHAMKKQWGEDFYKKTLLCGDSVGAIIAFQLACGLTSYQIEMSARNIQRKMRIEPHFFDGQNYWLNQYLDHVLYTRPTLHKDLHTKFQCGTTAFFIRHQWHKSWTNNDELGCCIKGSTNIPLYCDHCSLVEGTEVVDGAYGLCGEQFPHGNDTLFVGANQTCAEINYDMTIYQLIFPDNTNEFDFLFKKGYYMFEVWDGNKKEKVHKLPNYIGILFCWIGKAIQFFFEYVVREIIEK